MGRFPCIFNGFRSAGAPQGTKMGTQIIGEFSFGDSPMHLLPRVLDSSMRCGDGQCRYPAEIIT